MRQLEPPPPPPLRQPGEDIIIAIAINFLKRKDKSKPKGPIYETRKMRQQQYHSLFLFTSTNVQ